MIFLAKWVKKYSPSSVRFWFLVVTSSIFVCAVRLSDASATNNDPLEPINGFHIDMMYHLYMKLTCPILGHKPMRRRLLQFCRPFCALLLSALLVAGQAATLAHEADPLCEESSCQLCEAGVGEPSSPPAALVTHDSDTALPIFVAPVAQGHARDCSVTMARAPPDCP